MTRRPLYLNGEALPQENKKVGTRKREIKVPGVRESKKGLRGETGKTEDDSQREGEMSRIT